MPARVMRSRAGTGLSTGPGTLARPPGGPPAVRLLRCNQKFKAASVPAVRGPAFCAPREDKNSVLANGGRRAGEKIAREHLGDDREGEPHGEEHD
jgi:hypothetical protein